MNKKLAMYVLAACLGTGAGAYAHQTTPDPAVKTGDGKAEQVKKTDKHPCTAMQGGVDASGAETVEAHAKTDKAKQNNACGRDNGKASAPHAAPTTPHPDVKR
ncbi:hypothetical protein GTP44_05700 [Duganella sp. FT50W]|uniref:Uncharacterized protein n=1 Tax=Duganella lactea TaxID=2692173 RepID=A0A6L8MI52_9BURK|nr:hypothetical protein [Duganella lactea]MYM81446.1 hypothetical protein [Duganella lactea]